MEKQNKVLRHAVRTAIGLSLIAPSIVFAQATDSRVLGVTQSTGTHIRQIDVETAAPVDVLDLEFIESTGAMSIGEVIQNLPVIEFTRYCGRCFKYRHFQWRRWHSQCNHAWTASQQRSGTD
jgi:outer membrane cobalamin receptor